LIEKVDHLYNHFLAQISRLPIELETAALGGALQAAACHQGIDVAEYIRQNPAKLSEKVR